MVFGSSCADKVAGLKNGDLIFQTSRSSQSQAIQLATNSKWSHCGIVVIKDGAAYVFEASTKVKMSPFSRFVNKGEGKVFAIRRLKHADSILTPQVLQEMEKIGKEYDGLPYDSYFGWGDDKIYCSELIWKIYQRAVGLEIGKLEKLKDFNLKSAAVQKAMKERYGDSIPYDETVISPDGVFQSDKLEDVKLN